MRVIGALLLSVLLLVFLAGCSEKGTAEELSISESPFEAMVKKLGDHGVLSQPMDSTVAYPFELSDEMKHEGISVASSNQEVFDVELEGSGEGLIVTTSATEPSDQSYVILEYTNNEKAKPIIAHIPLVLQEVEKVESAEQKEVEKKVQSEEKTSPKQSVDKNAVKDNNVNSAILGVWYSEKEQVYMSFMEDGSATFSDPDRSENGFYQITGDKLKIIDDSESDFVDFEVKGDQLILGYQGYTQTLVRSTDEAMKDSQQYTSLKQDTADKTVSKSKDERLPSFKAITMPKEFYEELKEGKVFDSKIQLGMTIDEMKEQLGEPKLEYDYEGTYYYSYGTYNYGHGYMQDEVIEAIWYQFDPLTGPTCDELEENLGPVYCKGPTEEIPDEEVMAVYNFGPYEVAFVKHLGDNPNIVMTIYATY